MRSLARKPGKHQRILFVRCDAGLVRVLEERREAEQRQRPNRKISLADIVRTLLLEALGA